MNDTSFFRNRWWVVVASVLGLIVGAGSINVFAFGLFLKPISDELGVGRGVISSAGGMASILTAVALPFFGRAMDKWGVRAALLPTILLFAIMVAALSMVQVSLLYVLYPLVGLFAVGSTPAGYSKAISAWFDRQRGLALGIALAGVGLGTALVPQITQRLITAFGWREAYVGLGLVIIVLALLPALLWVHEPGTLHARNERQAAAPGLTLREAVLQWRYWALTVAFFIAATAINGTLTHVVPMLTDRGYKVQEAVGALSLSGVAIIFGRIFSGWLLDKISGTFVAVGFFLCPLAGIWLLYSGFGGNVPLLGTSLCGFGIGAEFDIMAFFVGRHFGMRAFGALYGLMFGISAFGNALGSNIMGWSFQLLHSYTPAFLAFTIGLVLTCLLFLPLGPYRYAPHAKEAAK